MNVQRTKFQVGAYYANPQSQAQYQLNSITKTTQTNIFTQNQHTAQPTEGFYTFPYTINQPIIYYQNEYITQPKQEIQALPFKNNKNTVYPCHSHSPTINTQINKITFITRPKPIFKLLKQSTGISQNEQKVIVSIAENIYQNKLTPINSKTAEEIKKILGGNWIVNIYNQDKPINMNNLQDNDYIYFKLDNLIYHICRIKKNQK